MDYTLNDLNEFKQGYAQGRADLAAGLSEKDSLSQTTNSNVQEGIRQAYHEDLIERFRDSVKEVQNVTESSAIVDACKKVRDNYLAVRLHLADSTDGYSLRKVSDTEYDVMFNGEPHYKIVKEGNKWKCSCAGFKYRGTCKHIQMLNDELHQSTERLPQHLARVRMLEQSLATWQKRLEENPEDKMAQKNVAERTAALEQAKARAEEIEAQPKPQRHPREEFEGAIPAIDKLFEGLGTYEIVGSWRRGKKDYKDVDILTLMSPEKWDELKARLQNDENFGPAPGHEHIDFGDEVIRGGYKNGDRVDYLDINRVPNPDEWGAWLLFRTGSAKFNVAMRGWLKKFGCGLSERGLLCPEGTVVASKTEEDIFNAIGIPFIAPEDREDASKFYSYVRKLNKPKFMEDPNEGKEKYRVEYQNEEGDALGVDVMASSEEEAEEVARSNYSDIVSINSIFKN